MDSWDHFFFECYFSSQIWRKCLLLCAVDRAPGMWDSGIAWMKQHPRGVSFKSQVLGLARLGMSIFAPSLELVL